MLMTPLPSNEASPISTLAEICVDGPAIATSPVKFVGPSTSSDGCTVKRLRVTLAKRILLFSEKPMSAALNTPGTAKSHQSHPFPLPLPIGTLATQYPTNAPRRSGVPATGLVRVMLPAGSELCSVPRYFARSPARWIVVAASC